MSTSIEKHVGELLKQLHGEFIEDKKIMTGFAEQHHTTVEVMDIFGVLQKPGVYHILLPFQWSQDAEKLLNSPSLNEWCGDMRQAVEVAQALGVNDSSNAKVVQAGGGVQVLDRRQKALANVERAYLNHNPQGVVNKVTHSGHCGRLIKDMPGANGDSSCNFYNIVTRGGADRDGKPEIDLLHSEIGDAADELFRNDVPMALNRNDRERVHFHIAHVTGPEHGSFTYLEEVCR